MKVFLILGSMATAAFSAAVTGVVPNAFAGTEGPSTFSLTTNTAGGRTYQFIIDSSQLTAFVNTNITGMQFRLNTTASWPTMPVTMSFFNVFMGASVDPTAASNTFASNFTGSVTQVRNGSLSFNPGDFGTGGSPNTFGPTIGFNMSSYFYTGGDLSVLLRFATQSGTGGIPGQAAFDAIDRTDTGNGWGTKFAAKFTETSGGTAGGNGNFIVTQFTATPVPEPATMAVLGLGAIALIRRRRK